MPELHAPLYASPSAAHRWTACTPAPRLEMQFAASTSTYAEEGTKAHAMAEAKLLKLRGDNLSKENLDALAYEDADMDEYTTQYKDFVEEELNAAKAIDPAANLLIEQQFTLGDYVPEGFGTSDAVIVTDKVLTVIDFKYGKGVPVDADHNPQLMLYALGSYLALSSWNEFTDVRMIIFQPRIGNITDFSMSVEELLDWAENVLKIKAQLAREGKGEFVVGDHCKFCRAGAVCKARMESIFPVMEHDQVLAPVLKDEEIPELLSQFDAVRSWMDAVEDYAQAKAINEGYNWPGYKLVEARTVRKIPDQLKAMHRLQEAGFSKDEFTNVKLKGIGELEKLVGKTQFKNILGDLVIKPTGAPTLVKDSDKRPAITSAELAFKGE